MSKRFLAVFITGSMMLMSIGNPLHGQPYKELHLRYRYQLMDTWCWAAAMEMVMNFHHPAVGASPSQADIINRYSSGIRGWGPATFDCESCDGNITVPVANIYSDCSFSIDFSTETTTRIDYLDRVFGSLNFLSSQEVNVGASPIPWMRLKNQIDACRPFIAFIDPLDASGINSDHAVAIKGYYENNSSKFLIANDPWHLCDGGENELFIPYANFHGGNSNADFAVNVEHVWAIVGDIRPNTVHPSPDDNCASCTVVNNALEAINSGLSPCFTTDLDDAPVGLRFSNTTKTGIGGSEIVDTKDTLKNTRLASILSKNASNIAGFLENRINEQGLQSILGKRNYFGGSVKYLSLDQLGKCFIFHAPHKISKALDHREEVIDVVSGAVDTNIVSTFQKDRKGMWHLKKIANFTLLKNKTTVRVGQENIVLSNIQGPDSIRNSYTYALIKVPPFQYEFYAFSYKGSNYMSPAEDYSKLDLLRGEAKPEKTVIGDLRKIANVYLKQYRRNFEYRHKGGKYLNTSGKGISPK